MTIFKGASGWEDVQSAKLFSLFFELFGPSIPKEPPFLRQICVSTHSCELLLGSRTHPYCLYRTCEKAVDNQEMRGGDEEGRGGAWLGANFLPSLLIHGGHGTAARERADAREDSEELN